MSYEAVKKGVVKRAEQRELGVFIDGIGLDRATRNFPDKVDLTKLIQGVSSGLRPSVVRYYTLIPNEDDHRHRSFLDAVEKSGCEVIVKRLPPKGINKQVSIEVEMAADIAAFASGSLLEGEDSANKKRIVTVVCPGIDLQYPIELAHKLGADTVTANFGGRNVLNAAQKWIDLSDSEIIWKN